MLHGPVFWGRTEPLVVGRTSSRGQSGPDIVSIYPYPAYATVPQARSEAAQGGAGRARRILIMLNMIRAGKGLTLDLTLD